MLIILFKFCRGYVKIKITGLGRERFLNLCASKNILIWGLSCKNNIYECYVSRRTYKMMEDLTKKTGTKIVVLQKKGLPFLLYRYRKRKIFAISLCLIAILLYISSLHVWKLEVEGEERYTKEQILTYLREKEKICAGTKISKIDAKQTEEHLRETFPDLAWVSCEITGTRLCIHLKETLDLSFAKMRKKPCDIVAKRDGTITEIVTRSGTPLVKKGDRVKKGEILISGVVYLYDDADEVLETALVCADGDVSGKSIRNYKDSFSRIYYKKAYTGKKRKGIGIYFGEKGRSVYFGKNTFETVDTIQNIKTAKIGPSFYLPISVAFLEQKQYLPVKHTYSKEEAVVHANEKLNRFLKKLEKKGVVIIKNNVTIETNRETCIAKGNILVEEPLGMIDTITIPKKPPQKELQE